MAGLNPGVLGWTEFWLRVGILVAALTVVALATAVMIRIALDVKAGVGWIMRRVRRGEIR